MKKNLSTPQSVKRNSADHTLGDIIKSPSIHGEGEEMSLFIQQYPEAIAKQISLLIDLQQKKEKALTTAQSAKEAANNMKTYVIKKFLGHEYKSGNDKEIIEDIQNVLKKIAESEQDNVSALKTSFEFQEALSKSTELLFMMGCVNTAANEAMIEQIVSIRDNKTTLGKYQLTKEVKERILGVAQRLKVQQDIMARQNKHQADIKNLTETIQTKQDKIEGLDEIKRNAAKGATALQHSDIFNWAKEKEKPTYTPEEVGALPSSTFIPTKVSDLENDEGFLTEHQDISMKADSTTVEQSLRQKVDKTIYTQTIQELNSKLTETIQTKQDKIEGLEDIKSNAAKGATALQPSDISDWAKEKEKPSYTAEEVGALPSSTFIPTKVSDLENDEGFLTKHQDISGKANEDDVTTRLANKVDNVTYEETIMSFNKKLATNQKITIASLLVGGLSFIGMVALVAKFVFFAM